MVEPGIVLPSEARTVAVVHAKGSSKRLPDKNRRMLGDRPLFRHAIANALAAEKVGAVVIDSDADDILERGEAMGAVPLRRPPELADNDASGDRLALYQALNMPSHVHTLVQVVPTSPFVRPATIDWAITKLRSPYFRCDSVTGVQRAVLYEWEMRRDLCAPTDSQWSRYPAYYRHGETPNSKDMPTREYETSGLYVMDREFVLRYRCRVSFQRGHTIELSPVEAIDINDEADWELAELVWAGMQRKSKDEPRGI